MIKTIVILFHTEDKFALCYLINGDYEEHEGKDAIDVSTGNTDEYGDDETLWSITNSIDGFNPDRIPNVIKEEVENQSSVKVITCFTE